MPHAARQPWSWLIFDVGREMKSVQLILVVLVGIAVALQQMWHSTFSSDYVVRFSAVPFQLVALLILSVASFRVVQWSERVMIFAAAVSPVALITVCDVASKTWLSVQEGILWMFLAAAGVFIIRRRPPEGPNKAPEPTP